MSKNILVLTGSPRKGGNSDLMADAFIEGAALSGYTTIKFEAGRKNIDGCKACNSCYTKERACIFKDDFNDLAPLIEAADIMVFVSPLYFYSFTAQIKAAIDKMYSLFIGKRPIKVKECILMTCGETDKMEDFDGIIRSYELIADFLNWNDSGKLIIPNVNEVGDILKTDALKRAVELGRSL